MKRMLIAAAALVMGAALYSASAGIIITIDENGNGTWNDNGTKTTLATGTAISDFGGLETLYYDLPGGYDFNGHADEGDLLMTEPPANSALSDVIRFDHVPTTPARIYFYSDNEGGSSDSLADKNGLPTSFAAHTVTVAETGLYGAPYSDAANGYFGYHPGDGDVGAIYYGGVFQDDVTYNFISDVPEPTTIIAGALLLLPFGASTLRILRRNRVV